MKIASLVGARPQFVKEALLGQAVRTTLPCRYIVIHSGQHYDARMSDIFFQELGIPTPEYHLGIGSGTHAEMTGNTLIAVENVLSKERPDALIVYGDTNTTLAGALAAAKLRIPVVHVEAGIRMEPNTMPEEINRVLTDRISAAMCCCSALGENNLRHEGITKGVHVTGDVMYDLYLRMSTRFTPEESSRLHGVEPDRFIIATLHRDYNVDSPESLRNILQGLAILQAESGHKVILPLHPRTRKNIDVFGCHEAAQALTLLDPLGYIDLMSLTEAAALVITDSGGLQKEAFFAGKRSVVVMPDTGWRELTDCGWNILAATDGEAICQAGLSAAMPHSHPGNVYGSGDAAQKIASVLRTL